MKYSRQGFTLIELLVVVGLLGLIIAGALANMNSTKRKAYDVKARSCAHEIQTAEEKARTANQRFELYEALGVIRSCQDLTPTGNASELHYLYRVKHPRGNTEYAVTSNDIYSSGVTRSGAVLSADPAALALGLTGGPSGGPSGTPTAQPNSALDCQGEDGMIQFTGNALIFTTTNPFFAPSRIELTGNAIRYLAYTDLVNPTVPTEIFYTQYYTVTEPDGNVHTDGVGMQVPSVNDPAPDFSNHGYVTSALGRGAAVTPYPADWSMALANYRLSGLSDFSAPFKSCATIYVG